MAKNLVYYTVFGNEPYYENLRISIDSVLDIGNFDGEILVFSDKPFVYRGVSNLVLPLANSVETIKLRITCYHHFDFSPYNRVMFLDGDVMACRDVNWLFARTEDFTYFSQIDTYYTTGSINCTYMDWGTVWQHWWKRPINAGQYLIVGHRFHAIMAQWEEVCDRFAHRRVFELNLPFKRVWRDQVALNYLIRTGQLQGTHLDDVVRFPIRPVSLRPARYTLWHYAAFPVKAAGTAMRRRYEWIRAGHRTSDTVPYYKENKH